MVEAEILFHNQKWVSGQTVQFCFQKTYSYVDGCKRQFEESKSAGQAAKTAEMLSIYWIL